MNPDDEEITLPTMTAAEFDKLIEAANERLAALEEGIAEIRSMLQEIVKHLPSTTQE